MANTCLAGHQFSTVSIYVAVISYPHSLLPYVQIAKCLEPGSSFSWRYITVSGTKGSVKLVSSSGDVSQMQVYGKERLK